MEHDLVVIGGGAGGLSTARAARRRGARVLLVQRGPLGGDCTFSGCVPSKALIAAAARGATFDQAMTTVRHAVEVVAAAEDDHVVRGEGIDVVHGWACFRTRDLLDVDGRPHPAPRVVIATGAGPAIPPVPGLDELDFLTNETVFDLDEAPRALAVLGGGAIGCELAQAFRRLGCEVTVIEALERLLPREEPEASRAVHDAFAAEGIAVRVGRALGRVQPLDRKGAARLTLTEGETLEVERVLVAVGRAPLTEGLGLDAAGVATDPRGFVRTDAYLRTTARGVWAVGDVTGRLPFTHAAHEMGRVAAANALGRLKRRFHAAPVPWVTYTSPEVARVGVTEAEAAARGGRVAFVPMTEVDRAITAGETGGFVKLVSGPRALLRHAGGGRVLGATIVAPRAGEMIHEPVLAMRTRMFTGRLAQAAHAYPTWSVAIQQAAAQFVVEVGGRRARPARAGLP